MINKLILFAIVLLLPKMAIAQGFDWELSARMPAQYSDFFFGIKIDASLTSELSNFDFYEDDCNCGKFQDGTGTAYSIGLQGEYWLNDGTTALRASLNYLAIAPQFSANQSLPVILDDKEDYIEYQNTFSGTISYLALNIGAKSRLFNSHFYIAGGLQFEILMENQEKHIEKIVGPDWAPPFSTNPPSYSRVVSKGKIENLNRINISPNISFGYDIDFGVGSYISPSFGINLPITDQISNGSWKRISYNLGIVVSRWF